MTNHEVNELRRHLNTLDQKVLETEILKLCRNFPEIKDYYSSRFNPDPNIEPDFHHAYEGLDFAETSEDIDEQLYDNIYITNQRIETYTYKDNTEEDFRDRNYDITLGFGDTSEIY